MCLCAWCVFVCLSPCASGGVEKKRRKTTYRTICTHTYKHTPVVVAGGPSPFHQKPTKRTLRQPTTQTILSTPHGRLAVSCLGTATATGPASVRATRLAAAGIISTKITRSRLSRIHGVQERASERAREIEKRLEREREREIYECETRVCLCRPMRPTHGRA
jgi:hypothetical protein